MAIENIATDKNFNYEKSYSNAWLYKIIINIKYNAWLYKIIINIKYKTIKTLTCILPPKALLIVNDILH